jgi:hypothetical protein
MTEGRKVYLPRGRDPHEDLNLLSDCIAGSDAALFTDIGGGIFCIIAGKRVPVGQDVLRDVVMKYVVTKHAKQDADGNWSVEYRPLVLDDMILRALLVARAREDGALWARLPKEQGEPRQLSMQQLSEIKLRLKTGEPAAQIAKAHHVDVDEIRKIERAAR